MFTLTVKRARIALWAIPVLAGALMAMAVSVTEQPSFAALGFAVGFASAVLRKYCAFAGEKSLRESLEEPSSAAESVVAGLRAVLTIIAAFAWSIVFLGLLGAIGV